MLSELILQRLDQILREQLALRAELAEVRQALDALRRERVGPPRSLADLERSLGGKP